MVEFRVPPSFEADEFVGKLQRAFADTTKILQNKYELVAMPSAFMDKSECEHPDAKEFGCDPEMCAYDIKICEPPNANTNFRSAGGHIHIGRDDYKGLDEGFLIDPMSKIHTIKIMDAVVGNAFTVIEAQSKEAFERKKLYGKAGRHRPTDYGVEYRVLSNYWLSSPQLTHLAFKLTQVAVKIAEDAEKCAKVIGEFSNKTRKAIDTNNIKAAGQIVNQLIPDFESEIHELANKKWNKFNTEWAI